MRAGERASKNVCVCLCMYVHTHIHTHTCTETWCEQTLRFKAMLICMVCAHFLRGVMSSRMGFTFAQTDQILIMFEYPMLLVISWSAAIIAMLLRPRHLILFPATLLLAWAVSRYLAQVSSPFPRPSCSHYHMHI